MSSTSATTGGTFHANLLREYSKGNVFEKYEVVAVLGEGSIGAVSKVRIRPQKVGGSAFNAKKHKGLFGGFKLFQRRHKKKESQVENPLVDADDHFYALKSIQLARVNDKFLQELRNEIDILKRLDHPNIVRAHEVFSSSQQIYLVMELCDGGDLYTRAPYSERAAAKYTEDVLAAIRYMHEHGVVHRDLKFENIMYESTHPDACLKVIDFGLSKKFYGAKTGVMTDRVGTIYTMAPQVLQGMYSSKADMWSVGVIAYMLLSSTKPFYHKRRKYVIDRIMRGKVEFNAATWANISDVARDFCKKLIVVNPKDRLDAPAALQHEWMTNREQHSDEKPSEESLAAVHDNLVHYKNTSQLKKVALTLIAHRSSKEDIHRLRSIFEKFDAKKNGVLDFDEFRAALLSMDYPEEDVAEVFDSIDVNKNGHIMWTEFLAASIEAHGLVAEDRIAEAFDRIDSDDSGFISPQNLRDLLGKECTPEIIEAIIRSADKNNDGQISYQEFLEAFRSERLVDPTVGKDVSIHGSVSTIPEGSLLGLDAPVRTQPWRNGLLLTTLLQIPGGKYDTIEE